MISYNYSNDKKKRWEPDYAETIQSLVDLGGIGDTRASQAKRFHYPAFFGQIIG